MSDDNILTTFDPKYKLAAEQAQFVKDSDPIELPDTPAFAKGGRCDPEGYTAVLGSILKQNGHNYSKKTRLFMVRSFQQCVQDTYRSIVEDREGDTSTESWQRHFSKLPMDLQKQLVVFTNRVYTNGQRSTRAVLDDKERTIKILRAETNRQSKEIEKQRKMIITPRDEYGRNWRP